MPDFRPAFNSYWQPTSRRLPFYSRCSEEELQEFVQRLSLGNNGELPAIDNLLLADQNKKFVKFLDLPTEIRVRVYEYYVQDFPEFIKCPAQPPLARTCRLIRQEMLPIFYAKKRFEINYIWLDRNCQLPRTVEIGIDTRHFLRSLPEGQLSNLRRLRLDFRRNDNKNTWSTVGVCTVDIDLQDPSERVKVFSHFGNNPQWLARLKSHVGQRVQRVVDEAQEISGRKILTKGTFFALKFALEIELADNAIRIIP